MNDSFYPILYVRPEQRTDDEQLGTKSKFWFKSDDGYYWLFKEITRINKTPQGIEFVGEDWAEKVASEIARVLGIRAAKVELAEYQGKRGCASKSFIRHSLQLVHGNEILAQFTSEYSKTITFKQSKHTLENIIQSVQKMFNIEVSSKMISELASYIVLDALIGNTDRHHENWGVILELVNKPSPVIEFHAAPSYDHASSLGRELTDAKRLDKLRSGTVERYIRNGHGGIYTEGKKKAESPLGLAETAAVKYPSYFQTVLNKLRETSLDALTAAIARIPDSRISQPASDFATAMLEVSYNALIRIGR